MYVDGDGAGERGRGGGVEVGRAPAAVPVVCGRVLGCDGEEGDLRVVGGGVDADVVFGVVFCAVAAEGLDEGFSAWGQRCYRAFRCCTQNEAAPCRIPSLHKILVVAFQSVAPHVACRAIQASMIVRK